MLGEMGKKCTGLGPVEQNEAHTSRAHAQRDVKRTGRMRLRKQKIKARMEGRIPTGQEGKPGSGTEKKKDNQAHSG